MNPAQLIKAQAMQIGNMAKQMSAKQYSNSTYYKQFDCGDIFAGLSLETTAENADSLRSMPGVMNVWQMRSVPLNRPKRTKKVVPQALKDGYTMHHWTGVDKLHAAGIRGQGVKVAVIDTGIDYTHEAVCASFARSGSNN